MGYKKSSVQPRDRYLDGHGVRLHYLEWGNHDRQPMLLLHGFTGHAHVWDDLALSCQDHYHVLALDQRGHGGSQWSEDAAYSIDDHFADIARFVETLDLNHLLLVGHSMGGRNALFYAACHAHRVERLVLVDARPGHNPRAADALRYHLDNLPLQAHSLDEVVPAVQMLYPRLSWDMCYKMADYGYKKGRNGKFIPKYDMKMIQLSERSSYLIEDLWPFLQHVTCPTLIIRGKGSAFLSRKDALKMCKMMPQAAWAEIPEATHMPVQENPNAFKKVLFDFLKKKVMDCCLTSI